MLDNPPAARSGCRVRFFRPFVRVITVSIMSAWLAACTPAMVVVPDDQPTVPARTDFDTAGKAWWTVYFQIRSEPSEEPDWHIDALLADQVLAPAIASAESTIALWRFHRRAAQDAGGHRFSLLFYADRDTAQTVNHAVEQSRVAALLGEKGIVVETGLADLSSPPEAALEATSDASWPSAIQRSWPWYIMGVSQSWLRLIREVRKSHSLAENASIGELAAYYRVIHDEISALWRENGQHAYLHHLNALFGYQPVLIRETTLKRF